MRGCANAPERAQRCTLRALSVAGALLLVLAHDARAGNGGSGFEVIRAGTWLHQGVYRLDAEFDLRLGRAPREALVSGVPLYINIDMYVTRERNWWWDETVATLAQRYRLEYHALSRRFLVVNLNTGVRSSYRTVEQALDEVGRLSDFPLLDRVLVGEDWRYLGSVRVRLDLGKLPLPLVPGAYLSGDWRLASEEYQWLLK